MEELIATFDADEQLLLEGKTKDQVHPDPELFCFCAHVWIYNSKGQVLLQKRAANNRLFPNCWDISAAGHVDYGEDSLFAARREAQEEIGLMPAASDMYFGKRRKGMAHIPDGPDGPWNHNEFVDIYFLKCDKDIQDFEMQAEEVSDLHWVSLEQLASDLADPALVQEYVPHGSDYYDYVLATVRSLTA